MRPPQFLLIGFKPDASLPRVWFDDGDGDGTAGAAAAAGYGVGSGMGGPGSSGEAASVGGQTSVGWGGGQGGTNAGSFGGGQNSVSYGGQGAANAGTGFGGTGYGNTAAGFATSVGNAGGSAGTAPGGGVSTHSGGAGGPGSAAEGMNSLSGFNGSVRGMNPATINMLIQAGLIGVPYGYATGNQTSVSPVTVSKLGPPQLGYGGVPNALTGDPNAALEQQYLATHPMMRGMLAGTATLGTPMADNHYPGQMGYPAIEGVSPGLTAAPAGPSQGLGTPAQMQAMNTVNGLNSLSGVNANAPSQYASNQNFAGAMNGMQGFAVPGVTPHTQALVSNVTANMGTGGGFYQGHMVDPVTHTSH